jgi:undecaprenyl-diphosphatase
MTQAQSKTKRRRWRVELVPLLIVALIAGGAWAFMEVADEVAEGEMTALDQRLLLALRTKDEHKPIGPEWVQEAARDVTALGGVTVLAILTAAAAGFLTLQGKRSAALLVLLAIGSGALAGTVLKKGFARERPALVSHETQVYTSSFPSGHSMLSAVTYLTLGALLMRLYRPMHLKAYILVLAISLTVLIGASRVYLGVHWPTDVLGGWTAGATWAMLWWLVAWCLQRRGAVEKEEGIAP